MVILLIDLFESEVTHRVDGFNLSRHTKSILLSTVLNESVSSIRYSTTRRFNDSTK